ncbi:MAG: AbrB/MazE/SpoVT family DNA-binding domain-containing protein [Candidatus Aegiribacteria sp.]|nr:AbrB/MazE/SpoVT family DNA-binding domain-containing protein [Candidatus Aegiribacteria sp.]
MHTKIQKWGNSQGLRLAKNILEDASLNVGDEVDIKVQEGIIIIAPSKLIRGKYRIENLIAEIPADYGTEEVDWGKPVGREE